MASITCERTVSRRLRAHGECQEHAHQLREGEPAVHDELAACIERLEKKKDGGTRVLVERMEKPENEKMEGRGY